MSAVSKTYRVSVETGRCKACGYCAAMCPRGVFAAGAELNAAGYEFMTVVQTERCVGCLSCLMVCPDFALNVEEA